MPTVRFSARALQDLADIIEHTIANWGTDQASRYIDGLDELAALLALSPGMGLARDNLHAGLFAFPYEKHLLYYCKDNPGITVVRILHGRMDALSGLDFSQE